MQAGGPQHKRLLEAVKADLDGGTADMAKQTTTMQLSVVRCMYVVVCDAKKSDRLDIFVGNYGLTCRLAAALLVLLIVEVARPQSVTPETVLLVLFLLALQLIHRFGRHYATELVAQYLSARPPSTQTHRPVS